MAALTVLVVDDEAYIRDSLSEVLRAEGMNVRGVASVAEAIRVLSSEAIHLVLCDLRMPAGDGRTLLFESRRAGLRIPIIMITGFGTVPDAVGAMKAGAYDFLQKPVDPEELVLTIRRAVDHSDLRGEVERLRHAARSLLDSRVLIGSSTAMQRVRALCHQVAPTGTTVLITGESGTGKELASFEIHRRSARSDRALVHVNCATVPDDLFDSEFFGHAEGVSGGASGDRIGWFDEAEGGTLVLDEINALSLANQAKLLRVLETGEYQRVGESRTRVADVRVIAISNDDLAERVKAGAFRSDLYYRLQVFPIEMPPLRKHKDDIRELAEHLLAGFRGVPSIPPQAAAPDRLGAAAFEVLAAYDWPGNVRELRNVLERAAILVGRAEIEVDVVRSILEPALALAKDSGVDEFHLRSNLNAAERAILLRALGHAQNRRKEAAHLLGIDPRNMSYYLRKHGIADATPKDAL